MHTHARTCSSLLPAIACVHRLYDRITHHWWSLLLSKTHSWESWEFPLALWAPLPLPSHLSSKCESVNFIRCWKLPSTNLPMWKGRGVTLHLKGPHLEHQTRAIFLSRLICPSPQCPSAWFKLTLCQKSNQTEKELFTTTTKEPNYYTSSINQLTQESIIFSLW